jgi:hypothetical protein
MRWDFYFTTNPTFSNYIFRHQNPIIYNLKPWFREKSTNCIDQKNNENGIELWNSTKASTFIAVETNDAYGYDCRDQRGKKDKGVLRKRK